MEEPVRKIPGVASAHIEGASGRLVVELTEGADADAIVDAVGEAVAAVAAELASTAGSGPANRAVCRPGQSVGDPGPVDRRSVGHRRNRCRRYRLGGPTARGTANHPGRAALSSNQPRVVSFLESRLGRVGTDIALSATTASANGLTQAVGTPLLDLASEPCKSPKQ
ncbi:hypothetical protein H7I76_25385 [Mycolicibacterium vaccae]|nr:hypothetical protein [Mycolicibacterium vaccae]